jgi:hypothetical protein
MVVVISSAQNANSPWVRHEWELFLNEKLAGRKRGNLLTAASETCEHARLPIALRSGEIVPLTDNGLKKLLRYLT